VYSLCRVAQSVDTDRRPAGVRVLEVQPDLAEGLDEEQAALARRHVIAVLEDVPPGQWEPAERYEEHAAMMGLLVIDGLLARDLTMAGRSCSELLGPGDLLRPWDYADGAGDTVASASAWTVIEPSRLAVLDERFSRVACRWPEVITSLISRTLRRSRWMTIMLAISNLTRVDDRVAALMWHLADRWGTVTREGVVVPVPLTHDMIGKLVGAHRPSVTSALGDLQRQGKLERRTEGGWLLRGEPSVGRRESLAVDPGVASAIQVIAGALIL
jgi:CRP/FNR family transcriptional regulator, cyclic AMP receptor protein